jgi:hypothetical protein
VFRVTAVQSLNDTVFDVDFLVGADNNNLEHVHYVLSPGETKIFTYDLSALAVGAPYYFATNPVAQVSQYTVPDCSYSPTAVAVNFGTPTCIAGVLDSPLIVTSFNNAGGFENIDAQLTPGVSLLGFPVSVATGLGVSTNFGNVIPTNTPVGDYTLTVYNQGVVIRVEHFTIAAPCLAPPQGTLLAEATGPLGGNATATNTSGSAISFVVFAYASDGTDVKNTPDAGTTSFTLQPGESVTFPYTILPLPNGVTSYYLVLLPVLGDLEIARSGMIAYAPPVIYTAPSVSGVVARVGNRLPCSGATYSPNVNSVAFGWFLGGKLTAVKTASYLLSSSDVGKRAVCRISATDGFTTVTATSAASAVVALGLAPHIISARYSPTVVGTVKTSKTVKANVGRWTAPVPTAYGYQWLRDGKAIKGATKSTFKIPASMKGHKLSVRITASKVGYAKGIKISAAYKVG